MRACKGRYATWGALHEAGERARYAQVDVALVLDPIAGVGEALVAVATQVGLVLGMATYVLAHVLQGAAGLAAKIAAMLPRHRVRVPTLRPNLADTGGQGSGSRERKKKNS